MKVEWRVTFSSSVKVCRIDGDILGGDDGCYWLSYWDRCVSTHSSQSHLTSRVNYTHQHWSTCAIASRSFISLLFVVVIVNERVKKLLAIKIINAVKNFNAVKRN